MFDVCVDVTPARALGRECVQFSGAVNEFPVDEFGASGHLNHPTFYIFQ